MVITSATTVHKTKRGTEAVSPAYFVLILCNPYLSSEGLSPLEARISHTVQIKVLPVGLRKSLLEAGAVKRHEYYAISNPELISESEFQR